MDTSLFTEPYVIWFYIGIALLVSELTLPGLVVIFFGFGAMITSLILWMFDINFTVQLLIFLGASTILLALLRKTIKNKFFNDKTKERGELDDDFIGKTVIADIDFEPGHIGKVIFNGTPWKATSSEPIKKDQVLEIINFENITLIVKPK